MDTVRVTRFGPPPNSRDTGGTGFIANGSHPYDGRSSYELRGVERVHFTRERQGDDPSRGLDPIDRNPFARRARMSVRQSWDLDGPGNLGQGNGALIVNHSQIRNGGWVGRMPIPVTVSSVQNWGGVGAPSVADPRANAVPGATGDMLYGMRPYSASQIGLDRFAPSSDGNNLGTSGFDDEGNPLMPDDDRGCGGR